MKNLTRTALSMVLTGFILAGCSFPGAEKQKAFDETKIDGKAVDGMSAFAFDLFRELNREEEGGNVFISPLSVSTALTMTLNGAMGGTREAMRDVLGYRDLEEGSFNGTFQNLLPYLMQADEKTELDLSNSIWYRQGEAIGEEFLRLNRDVFDAGVEEMDFGKPDAADIINGWIGDATGGRIEKMIDPPISPDVVMYLINAVYFKGDWTKAFDEKETFETFFTEDAGDRKTIQMMSRKTAVDYGETEDFKVVRLPYGNGRLSMSLILPMGGRSVEEFIEILDARLWGEIKASLSETEDVLLNVPKFKMAYGIKNLNKVLSILGMETAFGPEADFSGIREGIFISRVLHKAVLEVNEKGSEAAAATVVEMLESAVMEPVAFIADRPFVFVIADDIHGSVLFMGKYSRVE